MGESDGPWPRAGCLRRLGQEPAWLTRGTTTTVVIICQSATTDGALQSGAGCHWRAGVQAPPWAKERRRCLWSDRVQSPQSHRVRGQLPISALVVAAAAFALLPEADEHAATYGHTTATNRCHSVATTRRRPLP
ncbi:unnamed protein product [Miscanthus lutarioriparius]|uniref:Uncharacterized protein n=1 Tax=Miscanthus lutarioriparius TaxID=422564 RepID=A0A811QXW4_9POAL|nr:unnamed protein product [Miscanthus lutarioriparius]